jgi:hypothetical protein
MNENVQGESIELAEGIEKIVDPFGDAPISTDEALRGALETGRIDPKLAAEIAQGVATITEAVE